MSLNRAPAESRLLQAVLELVHVGIREAVALGLAEPDAVDDRGVVETVGDDRVVFAEQRLEHAAIGVETGREHDCVRLAQVLGDRLFEFAMQRLRAADEAHRSHAEAELVHRATRRRDDVGVVGETQVIVGAEVDRIACALRGRDMDAPALRPGQEPLAFREARRLDVVERGADMGEKRVGHEPSRFDGWEWVSLAARIARCYCWSWICRNMRPVCVAPMRLRRRLRATINCVESETKLGWPDEQVCVLRILSAPSLRRIESQAVKGAGKYFQRKSRVTR